MSFALQLALAAAVVASAAAVNVAMYKGNAALPSDNGGPPMPAMADSYSIEVLKTSTWWNVTRRNMEYHSAAGQQGEREEEMSADDNYIPTLAALKAAKPTYSFLTKDKMYQAETLESFKWGRYEAGGTVYSFDTKLVDHFANLFTATLTLPKAETIDFNIDANNGVDLYIDSVKRVSATCCGKNVSTTVAVSKGSHKFEVVHYEWVGHQEMWLKWRRPVAPLEAKWVYMEGKDFDSGTIKLQVYDRSNVAPGSKLGPRVRKTVKIWNIGAQMKYELTDMDRDGLMTPGRDKCVAKAEDVKKPDNDYKQRVGDVAGSVRSAAGFMCRRGCDVSGPLLYKGAATVRGIAAEAWQLEMKYGTDAGWRGRGPQFWSTQFKTFYFATRDWQMPGNSDKTRIPLRVVDDWSSKNLAGLSAELRKGATGDLYPCNKPGVVCKTGRSTNDITNFVWWQDGLPKTLFDPAAQGFTCTGTLSAKAQAMGMVLDGTPEAPSGCAVDFVDGLDAKDVWNIPVGMIFAFVAVHAVHQLDLDGMLGLSLGLGVGMAVTIGSMALSLNLDAQDLLFFFFGGACMIIILNYKQLLPGQNRQVEHASFDDEEDREMKEDQRGGHDARDERDDQRDDDYGDNNF